MTALAPVHYRIEIPDPHSHLFRITLTIARPAALQRVSLPVWIPGSYLVREFAKHLQNLTASQGARASAKALAPRQLDKATWDVPADPKRPLVLRYEVYAYDNSVRTAWLDAQRAFFNGTSLCLRVHGQEQEAHALEVPAPTGLPRWRLATGLPPAKVNARGFGRYAAPDYDTLADCPVEIGEFWQGEFTACGIPHRFVVAGAAPSFDGKRLLADAQRICEAEIRFWHPDATPKRRGRAPTPYRDYLFLLNTVDDGYGGLEHRNSTALICGRRDLPRLGQAKAPEGYTTLLGLISHEYFHTWNVKRLRPAEFACYDYERENYTELLWFFEGFTSYYDDLLLRRAGLIDEATYLKLLNKTINQVQQTPGAQVQSVAQASFDAWIKYYRIDENTPNATVSYYTKGALVALCFDLTLRAEGRTTLDELMRALYRRTGGGPMSAADFAEEIQALGGRSFAREIAQWVHGTGELPLRALLEKQGVAVADDPAQPAQALGLRATEGAGGLQVKTVLRGSLAERAGFAPGDEWLGIETPTGSWRLGKLDELAFYAGSAKRVKALVARDKRLLPLALTLPTPGAHSSTTWRLALRDAALARPWLASHD